MRGRIDQHRFAMRRGWEAIGERQPGWIVEKLVEQMPMFWEAESMAAIHLKRGAYGAVAPALAIAIGLVLLLPYLALLPPFVLGSPPALRPGAAALVGGVY